jgi:hypothetical protein
MRLRDGNKNGFVTPPIVPPQAGFGGPGYPVIGLRDAALIAL